MEPVGGTERSVKGFEIGQSGPTYSSYNYVFQYKDHLGNVRLSYSDSDLNGAITPDEVIEESNYYPFGLEHKGYNTNKSSFRNALAQQWKFGGKEYNEELDLDWYDVSARNYDPALGRWMNLDPLAEQMRRHSPYNYAFDNPIYFIDPDGMAPMANDGVYINDQGDKIGEDAQGGLDGRVYLVKGSAARKVAKSTEKGSTIETGELNENKVFELASNEDRQSQKDGINQKVVGVHDREFFQVNMQVEGVKGTVADLKEGQKVVKGDKKASIEAGELGKSVATTMREYGTLNVTATSMTHTHNIDFAKINNDPSMSQLGKPSRADKNAAKNNPSIKTSVINTRDKEVHVLNAKGKFMTISPSTYFKKF